MNSSLQTLVTGANRGIGLELTRQLLEGGHVVHAFARNPSDSPGLRELKSRHAERLHLAAIDVTSDASVAKAVQELPRDLKLDLLFNNAGVLLEGSASLESLSTDEVMRSMATNAVGPLRVTRALLPFLRRSSRPTVINITSLMGSIGDNTSGGSYGYRMSKAALNMFTKCMAADYPEITTFSIHPGWVKTDMGGDGAPTEVAESARGIIQVALQATHKLNGRFVDFEGDAMPW